jgi:hypothetical protein
MRDIRKLLPHGYGKEVVRRLNNKYTIDQVYYAASGKKRFALPEIQEALIQLAEEYQEKLKKANSLKIDLFNKYGKPQD